MRGTDHLRRISRPLRVIAAVAGILSLAMAVWSFRDGEWGGGLLAVHFGGLLLLSAWIGKDAVDDPPSPNA